MSTSSGLEPAAPFIASAAVYAMSPWLGQLLSSKITSTLTTMLSRSEEAMLSSSKRDSSLSAEGGRPKKYYIPEFLNPRSESFLSLVSYVTDAATCWSGIFLTAVGLAAVVAERSAKAVLEVFLIGSIGSLALLFWVLASNPSDYDPWELKIKAYGLSWPNLIGLIVNIVCAVIAWS